MDVEVTSSCDPLITGPRALAHAIRDSASTIKAVRRADADYYQFLVDEETSGN